LAEPARYWAATLQTNRNCDIDQRCVWTTTGEKLQLLEKSDAELSNVGMFAKRLDVHTAKRATSEEYDVEPISLTDLLRTYNAPRPNDYLSIDIECSECQILTHFDFEAFEVKVITVEHDFVDKDRNEILRPLSSKGYHRIFKKFSQWDERHVKEAS
jgi:hypothetical protein